MKPLKTPFILFLALLLLLAPVLSACSVVSVVEATTDYEDDEPDETTGAKTQADTTAGQTTAETTAEATTIPQTTGKPEAEPIVRPAKKTGVPQATPYAPATAEPYTNDDYANLVASVKSELGAEEVVSPSRAGVTYANLLAAPASLDRAASREELLAIADYHAFYREGGFAVTLDYPASDADAELTYLARTSDLLPSLCSVFGTLSEGVLTLSLIFYPETTLVSPRDVVQATVLGGENTLPKGEDTLPGIDLENGVSVWDSEQLSYALSHGYAVSPIAGSPAAELVEAAQTILKSIVDDTMTDRQIAYRVYRWLVENAAYDYNGDRQASRSLDAAYKPDMIPARIASFRAEGPILYGVGVCFGYAKAASVLLGLEGLDVTKVVSFAIKGYLEYVGGRAWAFGDTIEVHSYNYIRIDGYDYLFDLSFAKDGKLQVRRSDDLSVTDTLGGTKDFCVGLSKEEQCTYYSEFPDDPYSNSSDYNPGSYHYLSAITYDGTHTLLLSTQAEAQAYYDYLLANVFTGEPEYRTVTLFFAAGAYSQSQLNAFLAATGVPYKTNEKNASETRTGAVKMVQIGFGK